MCINKISPNGWELICEKEVVCFVVESPLADDKVCSGLFALHHHLFKLLLFELLQGLVLLNRGHVDVVFRLGLGGLEGASKNSDLGVCNNLKQSFWSIFING